MKTSLATKTMIGMAVLFLAVLMSTYLGFEARENQIASRKLVEHTYQVLDLLEIVSSLMKDAETGQRGFLLTGDEQYLKPYTDAKAVFNDRVRQLRVLTADNAEQQVRIHELVLRARDKFANMEQTIKLRRTAGFDDALALVKSQEGRRLMDEIRRIVSEMIDLENRLLKERSAQLQLNTDKATNYSVFFSCLSMAALLISAYLLYHFIRATQSAETKLLSQFSIVKLLNESEDLSAVLDGIMDVMNNFSPWSFAAVWKVDSQEELIKCVEINSRMDSVLKNFAQASKILELKKGQGLPGRVWAAGRACSIPALEDDDNFVRKEEAKACGIKSAFAFPILSGNKVTGVIELYSKERIKLEDYFLDAMTSMGLQIGQYLHRKALELDTLQQRAFQKLIVDNISDGLVVANAEGKFVMSNPAAEELIGELLHVEPERWSQVFGIFTDERKEELFPQQQLPLARALNGESSDHVEMFVHNERLNHGRWISVSGRPVSSEAGDFAGGLVLMQDISHRKEAEKRVNEFYSTVSHELRTPLTSIRGSLGLMEGGLAGPITAKATKLLGIARNECERLVRLINDILDLRKIEAGMLELRENNVEAQHLIKRTVNGIRGMAQASNIDLVTELNTGGPVYCDEDRTIQVLTNLVSNAIKFSPKNGRVTIALIPGEGNTFRFVVKDKGAGIPENQMNKLFGKFQQIDQSDGRPKEGTGLGLAISKKIVEQHKGRIGVKSKPGEGTEFWFELPATFAPVPLIKDDHLGQHPSYPALIVEDDDPFAEILRCEMVQHGFEVIRASTLAEAQAVLSKTKPVVIMLDLTLPDGDGMDLIRQLNESIDDREILFVIVTGSLAQTEKNCNYPALVDWLNKPFDDERLQQALSAVRKRMKQATVLLVERDPAMREILKNHLELINVAYVEAEPGDIISNFRQHKPDLVIMDMVNPESGMHVLEQLKQESNGRVPVIVYSSQELNSEQEAHFKGSRVAFLMKSVSSEETLLQTVRNFLSGLLLKLPSD